MNYGYSLQSFRRDGETHVSTENLCLNKIKLKFNSAFLIYATGDLSKVIIRLCIMIVIGRLSTPTITSQVLPIIYIIYIVRKTGQYNWKKSSMIKPL